MIQKKYYLLSWLSTSIISLIAVLALITMDWFISKEVFEWANSHFAEMIFWCAVPAALPGTLFFIIVTWIFRRWLAQPNNYIYVKVLGGLSVLYNFLFANYFVYSWGWMERHWHLGIVIPACMIFPLSFTKKYFLKKGDMF